MTKRIIRSISALLVMIALCFSMSMSAQTSSQTNDTQMKNLKEVVSTHVGKQVTDKEFTKYLETTRENLEMFKKIARDQKEHPNYVAEDMNKLIAGMQKKLDSHN